MLFSMISQYSVVFITILLFNLDINEVSKECYILHMNLIMITSLVMQNSTTKTHSYCFITWLQASVADSRVLLKQSHMYFLRGPRHCMLYA